MNKEGFIAYARDELDALSEVDYEKEAMARIHRFKGQIDMLTWNKVITQDEAIKLYDELQTARNKAQNNIENAE
ncbi:hypothetical protein [Vibrio parahaemolyticus]|uniref:hypothetical protein n=1 Tax=Vibrio parahaemolyticus TaxID=670 RepID=UPI001E3602FB|nr:hypothetical protein [Vibrio parahaemolyticus]